MVESRDKQHSGGKNPGMHKKKKIVERYLIMCICRSKNINSNERVAEEDT